MFMVALKMESQRVLLVIFFMAEQKYVTPKHLSIG